MPGAEVQWGEVRPVEEEFRMTEVGDDEVVDLSSVLAPFFF